MADWWTNLTNLFQTPTYFDNSNTTYQAPTTTVSGTGSSGGGGGSSWGGNEIPDFEVVKYDANELLGPLSGSTSSGSGTYTAPTTTQTQQAPTGPSPEELYLQQIRNSINSGWDAMEGGLRNMLNTDLPNYRSEQERIAQESARLSREQALASKTQAEGQVAGQEKRNLKDLSANLRNLFQAGNVYLGQRGAGDSSAANQYGFALTKVGSKARGDIKAQVGERLGQIQDMTSNAMRQIDGELNQRIGQIADWFYSAQTNLKNSLAGAGLNRQKDLQALNMQLYNQALSYLQNVQAQATANKQMVTQWAMNNATNVQQLASNIAGASRIPGFQGLTGTQPTVNNEGQFVVPVGYNTTAGQTERDQYGNIIRR